MKLRPYTPYQGLNMVMKATRLLFFFFFPAAIDAWKGTHLLEKFRSGAHLAKKPFIVLRARSGRDQSTQL